MVDSETYPHPINYPKRNINYIRKPIPLPRRALAGETPDRRETQQLKVRIALDAEQNRFYNDPDHSIQSPEDNFVEIDSADNIIQTYTVPASAGNYGQFSITKYFVDKVNKILVVYHFDEQNLHWVRFVARLRKDLEFPQAPAMTMVSNSVYVFGSRGRRYVRNKHQITHINRREYLINREYNDQLGTTEDNDSGM
jgi:hypothetical protein